MKTMKRMLGFLACLMLWGTAMRLSAATTFSQPMLLTSNDPATPTPTTSPTTTSTTAAASRSPTTRTWNTTFSSPRTRPTFQAALTSRGASATSATSRRRPTNTSATRTTCGLHPYSDLSNYAQGAWYHRKFDMGAAAGKAFSEAALAHDTGNNSNGAPANLSGNYNAYFDNIKFTNAYGEVLVESFQQRQLPGPGRRAGHGFHGLQQRQRLHRHQQPGGRHPKPEPGRQRQPRACRQSHDHHRHHAGPRRHAHPWRSRAPQRQPQRGYPQSQLRHHGRLRQPDGHPPLHRLRQQHSLGALAGPLSASGSGAASAPCRPHPGAWTRPTRPLWLAALERSSRWRPRTFTAM